MICICSIMYQEDNDVSPQFRPSISTFRWTDFGQNDDYFSHLAIIGHKYCQNAPQIYIFHLRRLAKKICRENWPDLWLKIVIHTDMIIVDIQNQKFGNQKVMYLVVLI